MNAPIPRLTVITVAFNAAATLEQTILSVANQSAPDFEYIVIDGGSQDGTVEILNRLSTHVDRWVSESDRGIYDAMNKGVGMARGEWILFLNADDHLQGPEVLEQLLSATNTKVSIVAGRTLMQYADHQQVFHPSGRFGLMLQLPFMHPSTIVRRTAFEACGRFDLRYRLAADCDFFLRLISRGYHYQCIEPIVTVMRDGGASSRGYLRARLEYMQAYRRNMHDTVGAGVGFAVSMLMNLKARLS